VEDYYRESQKKIKLVPEKMAKMQKRKHKICKQIEAAYDKLVSRIIAHREIFKNQILEVIFSGGDKIVEEPLQDLLNQISQNQEKILELMKSKEKKVEDLKSILSPQKLDQQCAELSQKRKKLLETPNFSIEDQFTPEKLNIFFKIKIPSLSLPFPLFMLLIIMNFMFTTY
jgi:hypothetical protein